MSFKLLPLIVALVAVSQAAAPPLPAVRRQPPQMRMQQITPAHCLHDRIMLGPADGVAVWGNEQAHLLTSSNFAPFGLLTIGTMHNPSSVISARFLTYEGPRAAIPLRWSTTGDRLYIWNRRGTISWIDRESGAVQEFGSLDSSFRHIEFRATSHGNLEGLSTSALREKVRLVDGKLFYRGLVTLGPTEDIIAARDGDLELVRLDDSRDPSAPVVRASYTRWLVGLPMANEFDGGIAYVGAENKAAANYIPLQRPLIDLETGRVTGSFGPTAIRLNEEARLSVPLRAVRASIRNSDVILDASQSGNVIGLLTRSPRGQLRIRRISPEGMTEYHLCDREMTWSAGNRTSTVSVRFFTLNSSGQEDLRAGRPILVEYRTTQSPAPEAVIFIHGGPAGSLVDSDYLNSEVQHFLRPGRDVLGFSYSGSVGGGLQLTRRLTDGGMTSLEQDVDALVAWLDHRRYRRIYIIGNSFGAVPALLALSRHPEHFRAVFLTAPLLKLKDPEAWVNSGAFNTTSAAGQRRFEEAIFGGAGGRARFAAALDKLLATNPFRAADRIFFGEHDRASAPTDLPAGTSVKFLLLKGGTHATLGARNEVWRGIAEALDHRPM